jgi:hypothetical protein
MCLSTVPTGLEMITLRRCFKIIMGDQTITTLRPVNRMWIINSSVLSIRVPSWIIQVAYRHTRNRKVWTKQHFPSPPSPPHQPARDESQVAMEDWGKYYLVVAPNQWLSKSHQNFPCLWFGCACALTVLVHADSCGLSFDIKIKYCF